MCLILRCVELSRAQSRILQHESNTDFAVEMSTNYACMCSINVVISRHSRAGGGGGGGGEYYESQRRLVTFFAECGLKYRVLLCIDFADSDKRYKQFRNVEYTATCIRCMHGCPRPLI